MELKHGDKQQTFGTGAKRDEETGKPQFSLISPYMLTRLAEWLTKAVPHYGKDNWAKGLPLRRTWDSLMRHLIAVWEGKHDEDHEAALLCNVMFFIDTKHRVQEGQLPAVLDDMPTYCKEKDPHAAWTTIDASLDHLFTNLHGPSYGQMPPPLTAMEVMFSRPSDPSDRSLEGAAPPKPTATPPGPSEADYEMLIMAAVEKTWGPPKRPLVYLCGPITGQMKDHSWRNSATDFLNRRGIDTRDPLRGKEQIRIGGMGLDYDGKPADVAMGSRDFQDIRDADLIFVHFPYTPDRQSVGSLMEMGMASALGKPIVMCTREKVLGDHLFVRRFCKVIERDFTAALYAVRDELVWKPEPSQTRGCFNCGQGARRDRCEPVDGTLCSTDGVYHKWIPREEVRDELGMRPTGNVKHCGNCAQYMKGPCRPWEGPLCGDDTGHHKWLPREEVTHEGSR